MSAPDPSSLEVRAAVDADLDRLTAIYNHYIETTAFTFDVMPFSLQRRREWFGSYGDSGPHRVLVALEHGAIAGFAYSSPFRPKAAYASTVETSVYCAPETTGRGIGRALYAALFEALGEAGVYRAYALITLPNDPSEALHRRFGFERVGVMPEVGRKFDRYWDVAIYQRPVRLD